MRPGGLGTTIRTWNVIVVLAMSPIAAAVASPESPAQESGSTDSGSLGRPHVVVVPEPRLMALMAVALVALNAATHLHRARRSVSRDSMASVREDLAAD